MLICKTCSEPFEPEDSIGATLNLCQDCWEDESENEWWEMVEGLPSEEAIQAMLVELPKEA